MVQATANSMSAIPAKTNKQHPATAVLSVPMVYYTVPSASSRHTPPYRSTALRYIQKPSNFVSQADCAQCWKDGFFNRASLHSLGYIFHLGHGGDACPADTSPHQLTIIDMNGWHKLQVRFCRCGTGNVPRERYRQLLHMRWHPASIDRPKTAFTSDLLETYHKVTLQGKLNLYDFYHAIVQKTDNQGRSKPLVCRLQMIVEVPHFLTSWQYRYHEISRCVRQWRYLKVAKRGGGAHQKNSLAKTTPGSFAIECPACPHPGRNLPEGWDRISGEKK